MLLVTQFDDGILLVACEHFFMLFIAAWLFEWLVDEKYLAVT